MSTDEDEKSDDDDTAAKDATKNTTPSKGETVEARKSSRGRVQLDREPKKVALPPLIISVHVSFFNFLSV